MHSPTAARSHRRSTPTRRAGAGPGRTRPHRDQARRVHGRARARKRAIVLRLLPTSARLHQYQARRRHGHRGVRIAPAERWPAQSRHASRRSSCRPKLPRCADPRAHLNDRLSLAANYALAAQVLGSRSWGRCGSTRAGTDLPSDTGSAGAVEVQRCPFGGQLIDVAVTPSNRVQCGAITPKGARLTPAEAATGRATRSRQPDRWSAGACARAPFSPP
jgi:hypothetical protein